MCQRHDLSRAKFCQSGVDEAWDRDNPYGHKVRHQANSVIVHNGHASRVFFFILRMPELLMELWNHLDYLCWNDILDSSLAWFNCYWFQKTLKETRFVSGPIKVTIWTNEWLPILSDNSVLFYIGAKRGEKETKARRAQGKNALFLLLALGSFSPLFAKNTQNKTRLFCRPTRVKHSCTLTWATCSMLH